MQKKIKGRKRYIAVDILGNLLYIKVHSAALTDTKVGCKIFASTLKKYPTIENFSADQGYRKTAKNYVANVLGIPLHISKKLAHMFTILPKRWIVEKSFAWIGNFRRLTKDFEILCSTAENIL